MTRTARRIAVAVVVVGLTVAAAVAGTVARDGGRSRGATSGAEVRATLVAPPHVPPPIARTTPATVVIDLETTEVPGTLASGVEYTFWTFGGTVPGPSSVSARATPCGYDSRIRRRA